MHERRAGMDPPSTYLVMMTGPSPGAQFELSKEEMTLGRGGDCDVVIESTVVSRKHAKLTLLDGKYYIEDLGSANGTFVNEAGVLTRQSLKPGDRIHLGGVVLQFRTSASDQALELPDAPVPAADLSEILPHTWNLGKDESLPASAGLSMQDEVTISRQATVIMSPGTFPQPAADQPATASGGAEVDQLRQAHQRLKKAVAGEPAKSNMQGMLIVFLVVLVLGFAAISAFLYFRPH